MSAETDNSDDTETDVQTTQPTDDVVATLDVRQLLREHYDSRGTATLQIEGNTHGSHRELDPTVFHPSQVGYDEWLLLVRKLGLDASSAWNYFLGGEFIHTYIESALVTEQHGGSVPVTVDGVDSEFDGSQFNAEHPIEHEERGLKFVGTADCHDEARDVVYDFKSKGSFYKHDPPTERHLDQLHVYMRALDADYGQVVYVSKKDLEVRTWPEDGPFEFDEQRWAEIVARCQRVRDAILEDGFPRSADEIPFERPNNYFANQVDVDCSAFPSE